MTKQEAGHLLTRAGFRGVLGFEGRTIHLHIDPRWPPPVWETLHKLATVGYTIRWEAGVMSRPNTIHPNYRNTR